MQEKVSQREKNFRDTWQAIHEAAFTLAVPEECSAATVEDIAAAAGVSRRTFFNYFSSKEDAILGVKLPQVSDEIISAYGTSKEDELRRVVQLQLAVMRTALPPNGLQRRREAVEALPALRTRLGHLLAEVEKLVRDVLLNHHHSFAGEADHLKYSEGEELDVLLALASTVLRHAVLLHYQRREDLEPLISHTIDMFRKVVDQTR